MEKKIKSLEKYENKSCKVTFEDGSSEVVNSRTDAFYDYLSQYANDKGISYVSLVKEMTSNETKKNETSNEDNVEKKKSGKGKKVVKNLVVAGALITIITGAIHVERHNGFKYIKDAFKKDNNKTIVSYDENYDRTTDYEIEMKNVIDNLDGTDGVIRDYSQNKVRSYEDWERALNDVSMAVNSNMFEIENYVRNPKDGITGSPFYVDYSPLFISEDDISAVKYFCSMRNEFVKLMYEEPEVDYSTKVSALGNMYVILDDFMNKKVPINCGTEEEAHMIQCYSLSPMAQTIVGSIGEAALSINYDFSPTINERPFDKMDTIDAVSTFVCESMSSMNYNQNSK